jgi:uncharacterized protein YneF (UPF0154 family)
MPAWVWAILVVMGIGVAGGAAYFIVTRTAKKKK